MNNMTARPNRLTIKWTEEDDNRFAAENGKDRLEVFPSPFKPSQWCWRRLRMSSGMFWKVKDGGISNHVEAAMTAAGIALSGGPKEWTGATHVR